MGFKFEDEKGIILFEFLGVICYYNGIDIKQTSNYIDMPCGSYINQLCRFHGWENKNIKSRAPNQELIS